MTQKTYGEINDEKPSTFAQWIRYVTKLRKEDIGNADQVNQTLQSLQASITAITLPVKASGAELDTATDDAKFATAKALKDSHNVPSVAPGASGNQLTSNGTDWVSTAAPSIPLGLTLGSPQATTSGTAIDFTGIPAGVKRVTISFLGVSLSGTANPLIQIGPSGGVVNTGYLGTSTLIATGVATAGFTAGFGINLANASDITHGTLTLTLENSANNSWVAAGTWSISSGLAIATIMTAGSISLAGALNKLRVTTSNGTDTFDAGEVNISYE